MNHLNYKIILICCNDFSCFRLTKAGLVNQCALLQGFMSTSKDETARKIDQINFEYILPDGPAVAKKNGASKANNKEGKSKYDEYLEGLRDYQNGQISKLGTILNALTFYVLKINS